MSSTNGNEPPSVRPKRATLRAKRVMKDLDTYPHNMHPALVPGVSIEDQKIRYGVDKPLIAIIGVVMFAFITWGIISPDSVMTASSAGLNWIMDNLGWLFNGLTIFLLFFLLILAFSRYGRIPLGLDGGDKEFSTGSWIAMLFAAGLGIGMIFFGALEPLTHYLTPLPGSYDPASVDAIKGAIAQSSVHWGISAWAFYAIVGLAVGYASFRKGRVPLMSSILSPLWGGDSKSPQARIVDGMAIIATLFGTASSLGLGALQIGRGVEIVSGWSPQGNALAIGIISVLTAGTIASAVTGVAKGIRRLSNVNMAFSILVGFLFLIAGPTVFLLNLIPGVVMDYTEQLHNTLSATMSDGEETKAFLSGWSTFYWAWWVSWAPFVGVFIAKISRGRSIRQFILGVMFVPSTIMMLNFTLMGGTAIWIQRETGDLVPGNDPANMGAQENVFFNVIEHLPFSNIIAPIIIVMLMIFFITAADSASLINSQFSQGGNPKPKPLITAFWVILMAGIAIVMILMGGPTSLSALQNLITITALPFAIIIILMCVAVIRELRHDPMMIREHYEQVAVSQAVRQGIEEHGDNFELSIDAVPADSGRGVGAEFDSTAAQYTEWYVRTDEDGNPVDYDYATGTYVGEESGEPAVNPLHKDEDQSI